MTEEDGTIQVGDDIVNVKFGGGMELQNLHNSALYCMHDPDVKNDRELWHAARNYLLNLFIKATDALGEPIGGKND